MHSRTSLQAAEQAFTSTEVGGRRRPERNDQVSPHLIPLLRDPTTVGILPGPSDERGAPPQEHHLTPLQRNILDLAPGAPLWASIGVLAWAVLR